MRPMVHQPIMKIGSSGKLVTLWVLRAVFRGLPSTSRTYAAPLS